MSSTNKINQAPDLSKIDQTPDPSNKHLRKKLKKLIEAALMLMENTKEEPLSVDTVKPLTKDIFSELKTAENEEALHIICRALLEQISLAQGGYEFPSMFGNTEVIFENKEQQTAFVSMRDNLASIEINEDRRLSGLSTKDRGFNEELAGFLKEFFPSLEEDLKNNLKEKITKITIEKGAITIKCRG